MPESAKIDRIIKAVRRDFQAPVNRTIDRLLHPHFKQYPFLILVDGLIHGLNEMDPVKSIQRFLRYDGPKLIEELQRELERGA